MLYHSINIHFGGDYVNITDAIRDCMEYIDSHLDEELTVKALAEKYNYSANHFGAAFQRIAGVSLTRYVLLARAARAARELAQRLTVADVSVRAGFKAPSNFSKAFHKLYGVAPSSYSEAGAEKLPVIACFSPVSVAGYVLRRADGTEENKAALWHGYDFSGVDPNDFNVASPEGGAEVGVWTEFGGERCYIFGVTCKEDATIPAGMVRCELPPAEYAMFLVPAAENTHELYENINAAVEPSMQHFEDNDAVYVPDPDRPYFEFYHGMDTYFCVPLRENK